MKWMPLMGTGLAVRMDLLNEHWAQKNHSQSLERLAERGGLSCEEALAIAERRQWSAQRQEFESFRALALLVPNAEFRRGEALACNAELEGGTGEQT